MMCVSQYFNIFSIAYATIFVLDKYAKITNEKKQ